MPEYRSLRERHSLWDLFHISELAAAITLQPVDRLGVDAAILFSDILVIAEAFGLRVIFPEGKAPEIVPKIQSSEEIHVHQPVEEVFHYVKDTISLLKPQLKVPLIGFCGGPFTIATYMAKNVKAWMEHDPQDFHRLLDKITVLLIDYLQLQIKAGVSAIQIFDSWADQLSIEQFPVFSLDYLAKIVEALIPTKIPVILFCRKSTDFSKQLASIHPAAISFDSGKELCTLRLSVPNQIAIQGNLDPEFLQKASIEEIVAKTKTLLMSMQGDHGFIANLGHGVLPRTPVDNVRAFVDTVKTSL